MHPTMTDIEESTPLLSSGQSSLKGNTVYIYMVTGVSAIGGFLFGYDTGIISGAMIFIRDVFGLNEWWQEAIVSVTLLAAWLFSILAGSLTDQLGRKPVIVGSSVVFVVGSLLMAFAWNQLALFAGRLVVGAGVGLASMVVPMYIAEVAPSSIRGQLVMINMCCTTGGQFIATLIAYWFSFIQGGQGWRFMLGFGALPAAIQFCALLFMPESPRWLVAAGRHAHARQVLERIRPEGADIDAEFEAIRANCERAKRHHHEQLAELSTDGGLTPGTQSTFGRILANQPVRKALLVGCLLQAVQQLSGINTVMYYSASIFEMSGVYSKQKALLMSTGTGLVNFVFTVVGFALVERVGRRKLTLVSLFGVTLGLAMLGAGFQFAYVNSPEVDATDQSPVNQPCGTMADCSSCVRNDLCGFCFSPNASQPDTCLHVNQTHREQSLVGDCVAGSDADHVWAYEWCPSAYSWLILLGMLLYLMFFAPGMGPMPWTINSEIYPSWARSWCLSASTSVCWLFNLLVSMTFLSLTRAITKQGAFYLYASLAALGLVYFVLELPETRGKTLEELEDVFASASWTRRKETRGKAIRGAQ